MKKLLLISSLFIFISSALNCFKAESFAQNSYYAKITNENVYFYSDPIEESEKILFEIPNTYFVKLIDNANENFYYAIYKNVYGYVKKSQVNVMSGTPVNPFANATFRIFSPDGIGLYSTPSINQSVFCDQLSQIQDNYETFEIVENPVFSTDKSPNELSAVAMTFIIIGVSIPCLIVIYLLLKPTLLKEKVLNEKPKIKKKHHGDYFEFDDSELN